MKKILILLKPLKLNFLKRIIKRVLLILYQLFLQFDPYFFQKNKKTIIFDIDNTLANTWPTLVKSAFKNEKERLLSLELIEGAKELVEFSIKNYDQILFLSARNPIHYITTKKWIINNFGDFSFKLRLVPNASLKIIYWGYLSKISKKIVVLDDLSYNHENDNIKYYKNEIMYLDLNERIEYYNFTEIKKGLSSIKKKI